MTRVLLLAVLVALPGLAGCIQQTAGVVDDTLSPGVAGVAVDAAGLAPRLVDGFVYSTFTVTSATGSPVHAEVYLPDAAKVVAGATVPETFPTILLASPYNGDGYGPQPKIGYPPYDYLFDELVYRGYAIVVGDAAAMGGSGGCWDFMGPQDQAAAVALVEGIAAQPWSDGKVGMMGLSYDGMTQIMAASNVAEHLVTVVPAAPLTHAYAGLYMNGIHYGGGWMATTAAYTRSGLTPPGTNTDRYPGYVDSVARAPPCAVETNVHGNDLRGAYTAWWEARDFRPKAPEVQASVFFIQGFLDAAVKPDNMLPFYDDVQAPKKAWIGHWFHQYPVAANSGRSDFFPTLHRWFDHWLKGVPNGIDQELRVDVQDSQGRWRTEPEWPPADAVATLLALNADGTLAAEGGPAGTVAFGGPASVASLATRATSAAALFETAPLAADLHVAGMPRLNLTVASDRPGGQVVANLYDVGDDGARRISRGGFNLLLHETMAETTLLSPGQAVTVSFDLYPTDHVVPAGHRLRLVLETNDPTLWFNPDPWSATLSASAGAEGSFLTLPVVARTEFFHVGCGRPISSWVPDCFDADLEDEGVSA